MAMRLGKRKDVKAARRSTDINVAVPKEPFYKRYGNRYEVEGGKKPRSSSQAAALDALFVVSQEDDRGLVKRPRSRKGGEAVGSSRKPCVGCLQVEITRLSGTCYVKIARVSKH